MATLLVTASPVAASEINSGDSFTYETTHTFFGRHPSTGPGIRHYVDHETVVYPAFYRNKIVYELESTTAETSPVADTAMIPIFNPPLDPPLTTIDTKTFFDLVPDEYGGRSEVELGFAQSGIDSGGNALVSRTLDFEAPYHYLTSVPERPRALRSTAVASTTATLIQSGQSVTRDERKVGADGAYEENGSTLRPTTQTRALARIDGSSTLEQRATGAPTQTTIVDEPNPSTHLISFTVNGVPGRENDWIRFYPTGGETPALVRATNRILGTRQMPAECRRFSGLTATLDVATVDRTDTIGESITHIRSEFYDVPSMGTVCVIDESLRETYYFQGENLTQFYDRTASILQSETIRSRRLENVVPLHPQTQYEREFLAAL